MKKTLLTTLLCSLMITACSSGGSDDGQSHSNQNTEQRVKDKAKAQADKAEKKAQDAKDKADELKDKAKAEANKAEEKAQDAKADAKDKADELKDKAKAEADKAEDKAKDAKADAKDKADELKDKANEKLRDAKMTPAYMTVDVNGKKLDLTLGEPGLAPGYNDFRYDESTESRYNANYQHSVFGYVIDKKAETSNFFAQGESTLEANMPTEGLVDYHGDALFFAGSDLLDGQALMTANFGEKTVEGAIIRRTGDKIAQFRGDIHGNRFSANEDGLNVDGGFYGESAQEAAGKFEGRVHDKEITGAFAVKQ